MLSKCAVVVVAKGELWEIFLQQLSCSGFSTLLPVAPQFLLLFLHRLSCFGLDSHPTFLFKHVSCAPASSVHLPYRKHLPELFSHSGVGFPFGNEMAIGMASGKTMAPTGHRWAN